MIGNLRRGYRLQNRTSRLPLAVITEELYRLLSTFEAFCVARFVVTVGLLLIQVFWIMMCGLVKYLIAFRALRWSVLLRHGVLHQELILTHVACVVFLEYRWLGFLYAEWHNSVVIGQ